MKTNDNGRAEARSRANRRLRAMTIGTAVLGVAATGSLGWAAAMTYDGSTANRTAAAGITATDVTADGTTSTTTGSQGSTSTTATAPTVSSSSGNAHATTGGS